MITSDLLTHFEVDSGRASKFEAALASALSVVTRERSTLVWFAMRFGSSEYGILDLFPNEQARAGHVAGPVGQLVLGEGGPSLAAAPRVEAFGDETSRSSYLARGAPHELARHAAPSLAAPSLDGNVPAASLIDVVAAKLSAP